MGFQAVTAIFSELLLADHVERGSNDTSRHLERLDMLVETAEASRFSSNMWPFRAEEIL